MRFKMTYFSFIIISLVYEMTFYGILSFTGEKAKYTLPAVCSAMIGVGLVNTYENCVMLFVLSVQCICICIGFPIMIKYDKTKNNSAFMTYSVLCSLMFILLIGGTKGYIDKNNMFFMAVIILLTLINSTENKFETPFFKNMSKIKTFITIIMFFLLTAVELLLIQASNQILNCGFLNKRFTAVYLSVLITAPIITYASKSKNRAFCNLYFINCTIYITSFTIAMCLAVSKNNQIQLLPEFCSIDIPFMLSAATMALLPLILKTKISAVRKLLLIVGAICYVLLSVGYLT